jgi:L-ribulose-5-phosphate 4-epimerase
MPPQKNGAIMLEKLKEIVCEANIELQRRGLVVETWGNVSGLDRERGLMVIKPSGVPYSKLRAEDMVVLSLQTAQVIEGQYRPSSDTPTHLELYRAFGSIGGITHTHSLYATAWAQACRDIPALGTTHADYFAGPIPCTKPMTDNDIQGDYEANTGKVIIERFASMDPLEFPAVLVANHGPFTWGQDVDKAVENASVLEHLAHLAIETLRVESQTRDINRVLLDKHFRRKHGPTRYYGQK